jgi:hypothetical protein
MALAPVAAGGVSRYWCPWQIAIDNQQRQREHMKPTILSALMLAAGLASAPPSPHGKRQRHPRAGRARLRRQGVHEHRSVLVRDGVIVDADFRGKAPAGARVVPGAGRTLLPGLIDAHVHTWQHFELPLVFGVTTQVDMFTGVDGHAAHQEADA